MRIVLGDKLNKQELRIIDAIFLPARLEEGAISGYGKFFEKLEIPEKKIIEGFVKKSNPKDGEMKFLMLGGGARVCLYFVSEVKRENLILQIRKFVRAAKSEGAKILGLIVEDFPEINPTDFIELAAIESLSAHYDFSENYKTPPKGGFKKVEKIVLFAANFVRAAKLALRRGIIIGEAINRARTISNYPGGELAPEGLAEAARELSMKNPKIEVTVFDERKLEDMGMNAILAVGKGSANPPRLIIMEYRGGETGEYNLALVGKGITFDSGGLNIKPGDGMSDMHLDMSGGAAVISALGAIADLKLPINVLGIVAAAENMPSGLSYRQGDIIKSYSGKTIEVGNTDAEGRVVLSDAISYARTKKPALIVTLATLTGAAMVALGTRFSGLFVKNNKPLQDEFLKIGEESGDNLWPLPLASENERDVEGAFADVTNTHKSHSRYGGASTGAAFLSHFAENTPLVHIDMAPRMLANTEEENLAKGSVGFGVKLFLKLAERWREIEQKLE
jgi:leucyl aminopeptidase